MISLTQLILGQATIQMNPRLTNPSPKPKAKGLVRSQVKGIRPKRSQTRIEPNVKLMERKPRQIQQNQKPILKIQSLQRLLIAILLLNHQ